MTAQEFQNLSVEQSVLLALQGRIFQIFVSNEPIYGLTKEEAISLSGPNASMICIFENGEWKIWSEAQKYFGVKQK